MAGITQTLVLGEADTGPTNPQTTAASFTPVNGRVYLGFVCDSTGAATLTSMTGNGLTWAIQQNATRAGNFIFYGLLAIAGPGVFGGQVTLNFTGVPTGLIVQIIEVAGDIDNVSPIVQSPTANGAAATSSALPFSAFSDPVNNAICFATATAQQGDITSADGSELTDLGHAAPVREAAVFANIGQDLSAVTSFASAQWGAIGFELRYKLATPLSNDSIGVPMLMGHGMW